MIELANERSDRTTGYVTRFWDVVRDGVTVAFIAKTSQPFAKWRVFNDDHSVRETFASKAAAVAFAGAL